MILDVGCGKQPKGDVNVDLFLNEWTVHLHGFIDAKKIPNPVRADAHHLPFRDNSFDTVYSYALLEHVNCPSNVLKELIRVASHLVEFMVPHRYFRHSIIFGQSKEHKHFFSEVQVKQWIERLGHYCEVKVVRRGYPSDRFPIMFLPWTMVVKITLSQY